MTVPAMLDSVQWLRIRREGRSVEWDDDGPAVACHARELSARQSETDEALQERSVATHRIVQWHKPGLSRGRSRAVVTEATGRARYTLELVRFKFLDAERRLLQLDCRSVAPGSPVT